MKRAEDWRWSSAARLREGLPVLTPCQVRHSIDWLVYVNDAQSEAEVEALRECIRRRRPYGRERWTRRTAQTMGLEASLRPLGRPRKKAEHQQNLFDDENPAQ